MLTHYQVLRVPITATSGQIKKAYKKLVFLYHPDRNGGDIRFHELMVRVNEAYSVLINPARRLAYDSQLNTYAATQPNYYRASSAREESFRDIKTNDSRWSFSSPTALVLWFGLSFVGRVLINRPNSGVYPTSAVVEENASSYQTIQDIFSTKADKKDYRMPVYNRIYDSLNNPQFK